MTSNDTEQSARLNAFPDSPCATERPAPQPAASNGQILPPRAATQRRSRIVSEIQSIAPQESRLKQFLFMRSAIVGAERRALRAGEPGFAEYEVARALQAIHASTEDNGSHWLGTVVLLRLLILYAAEGLARHDPERAGSMRPVVWAELATHADVARVMRRVQPATLKHINTLMCDETSVSHTELATDELLALKESMTSIAFELYKPLVTDVSERARLLSVRLFRWVISSATVLALVCGGGWQLYSHFARPNMALHADVATSSYTHASVYPPTGVVDGDRNAVGCSIDGDQTPWVQIDLGRSRTINRVVVTNRADDVSGRGLPLVIDLSIDGKTFVDYERKAERFTTWTTTAPPGAKARYVRVVLHAPSMLQLTEIEVY